MKIAVLGDTHIGYPRFYADSIAQARAAFNLAAERADLILHAGDFFDTRIPTLETLREAISMLIDVRAKGKPIIAIHGNHERRMKGFSNPLELLAKASLLTYLHGNTATIEDVSILGVGSVPNQHAQLIIKEAVKRAPMQGYKILLIHQDILNLSPAKDGLSLSFLEELGMDLIVNGHIHKRQFLEKPKLLIPGSTVVAAMDESELSEKRGFYLFDTKTEKAEFVEIPQREFIYKKLEFSNASYEDVISAIEGIKPKSSAFLVVKLIGTLKEGLIPSLLPLPRRENLHVINKLTSKVSASSSFEGEDIIAWGEEELRRRLGDKLHMDFDKLFELLLLDVDEAWERIQ